jgi:hypothetical protein
MNMFRDLAILFLLALGISLTISNPDDWKWIDVCGPYVVQAIAFMVLTKPMSIIICMALALALFMTRLKY